MLAGVKNAWRGQWLVAAAVRQARVLWRTRSLADGSRLVAFLMEHVSPQATKATQARQTTNETVGVAVARGKGWGGMERRWEGMGE